MLLSIFCFNALRGWEFDSSCMGDVYIDMFSIRDKGLLYHTVSLSL